ncbi:MAG: hypothetical protein QM758_06265 [Armatimonas sp.]
MAWIELHQSLFTHRKTIRAARRLQVPAVQLVGHLALLWTWALDNAPDGNIDAPADTLETVLQWTGLEGALIAALVEVGFLHPDPHALDRYAIHDWFAYAGRLMEQRKQNASRMRAARAEKKASGPAKPVRDACAARAPATVPNPTVPYQTQPEGEYTPALRTLYEAFRAQRHPDSPSHLWGLAEWNKALPYLKLLLDVGATLDTVKKATTAALTRWKHAGQVTVKAIAEHWTELLEPEPTPKAIESPPVRLTPQERRAAEWREHTQRELEIQLAAFDEWEAAQAERHNHQDGNRPAIVFQDRKGSAWHQRSQEPTIGAMA